MENLCNLCCNERLEEDTPNYIYINGYGQLNICNTCGIKLSTYCDNCNKNGYKNNIKPCPYCKKNFCSGCLNNLCEICGKNVCYGCSLTETETKHCDVKMTWCKPCYLKLSTKYN